MRKENTIARRALVTLAALGLLAVSFPGCNGSINGGPGGASYLLQAYLLRDMGRDLSAARVSLKDEKGLVIPNATVAVDSMMLPYVAANRLYEKQYLSADSIANGSHRLTIDAIGEQILNQNLMMTDTFTAEVIVPFNKLYTGGLQVQVGLSTISLNAQGYVVAVVPRDSVYMGTGYVEFVPLSNPVGNIPPDVFRDPLFPDSLLEGVWYIYMYAYTGSPQIDGVTDDLPTALPDSGFTPNLNLSAISGSVGAILVSKRDTLVVQKQP